MVQEGALSKPTFSPELFPKDTAKYLTAMFTYVELLNMPGF